MTARVVPPVNLSQSTSADVESFHPRWLGERAGMSRSVGESSNRPKVLRRSHTLASALLLQALLLVSAAVGAPVLLDEATPPSSRSPELTTESGHGAPTPVSSLPGAATTQAEVSRSGTPPPQQHNPTSPAASDPARLQSHDAARELVVRNARSKVTGTVPAIDGDGSTDIDPDLKEAAKTALQWAREAKHWVTPASSGADDGTFQQLEPTDGSTFEKGRGAAGSIRITPSKPEPGTDLPYARSTVAEIDLIREAIKFIREVAWNPVTWLLMPLVALASVAVWVVQNRAQTERRQMSGLAARGQRGSPAPHRRKLKRRSSQTAGTPPPPELRSDVIPVRPRLRRSAKRRLD